jgi:6-phosphogluconolactonase (cycloisomerase 2 family)
MLAIAGILLFATSCKKNDGGNPANMRGDIIYLESNDSRDNQNKIIAYYNTGDGKLQELPGSPFPAGGSGVGNPGQLLGPLDSDDQLRFSADGKFLLAVNSGSHTIAVLKIGNDGTLAPVPGSPFPSGGQTPVSLGINGNYVYVVNKSQDYVHTITAKPNYTVLTIDNKGALKPVTGSTIETGAGSSPSNVLISRNGKFAFGTDFLGFMLSPAIGTLRSFTLGADGRLSNSGTPQALPEMGGALGLTQNPKDNTLYVGFPVTGKVGVYNIDASSGILNFVTSVASGPAACWLRTAHGGNNLYALNSAENSISIYNTAVPKAPLLLNKLMLKQAGPLYAAGENMFTTSQDFSFEFSPAEDFVYVVSQHTNTDFSIGNYNYIHVLNVAVDGTLQETGEPLQLPVPNMYRPQGVLVYHAGSK